MSTKLWIGRAAWLLNLVFVTSVAVADAGLRPGDQIELKLSGVPSTEITSVSGSYTLDGAGSVNLPYIGRIKIGGLASGTAQSTIEGAYKARGIYTNPTIVITMQEKSRFVNVGGEVKTPQRVPFTADLTVLSSINAAGGFSPYADQRKVRLLRGNQVTIVDIKKVRATPSLDLPLQPGDRVDVPQSLW
jgi:polysaccharide export outer membrane protein